MYKVKYETLLSVKEFSFEDRSSAEAFLKGIESLKNYLSIIHLELIEVKQ